MPDYSRRTLSGLLGSGLVGAGLITPAAAAETEQQPGPLFGSVRDGRVSFPPIHADSESGGEPPNPDALDKRLGVAVVGLGNLSLTQIIPGFGQAKHVRLAALVSGRRDKANAVAAQYGVPQQNVYGYDDFDRIKDNAAVDIVYIVLPNSLHAEYTVRAAQAGKHVLCEKPMATSVADAQRMVDACKQANRRLMIAYRMQYVPAFQEVVAQARGKQFGEVRFIEAVNGQNDSPNGQWRQIKALAGGGSLPDVGLYCLNCIRAIVGEEPVEVTGQITQPANDPRFREIEDLCTFTLRFPSGLLTTGASGYSFHESRRLRVNAAGGWFGLDPAFGYEGITMRAGYKAGKSNAMEERHFPAHNQFALEMDHFAECIRDNKQPRTPGEEGLQDQKIMAAIYQSAANGGAVVKLPKVDGIDTTRGPMPAAQNG